MTMAQNANIDTTAWDGDASRTPHIDKAWREDFIIEQRLADRTGAEIGDALATIDAHCAESGEGAQEAFGDPTAYSRSLVEGTPQRTFRLRPATVIGLVLGLFGLLAVPRAVAAWVAGTDVTVSRGDLVAIGVTLALTLALALRPGPALAWLLRHRWLTFALPFVVLIALLIPQVLMRQSVTELDWPLVATLGVIALGLQVVLTWRDFTESDDVVDPRQPASGRSPVEWLTAFIFPFLTLVVLGMDAIFRTLD